MSCWRNYQCDALKDVDKDLLTKALKEVGLDVDYTKKTAVGQYENRTAKVDGVLLKDGEITEVGVILSNKTGHLQLVGDFWGTGINEMEIIDTLSQQYQKINALHKAQLCGWTLDEMKETEKGIELEFYMYN